MHFIYSFMAGIRKYKLIMVCVMNLYEYNSWNKINVVCFTQNKMHGNIINPLKINFAKLNHALVLQKRKLFCAEIVNKLIQ